MNKTKQTILITGSANRIGRHLAVQLSKNYNLIIHYNKSRDNALSLQKQIQDSGCFCELIQSDFNNTSETKQRFEQLFQSTPQIDVVVHNASIFQKKTFSETSMDFLDHMMNIHFKTPFLISRLYAKFHQKGHIIHMLDTRVKRNQSQYFAYTISKKMLKELTTMLAYELAPHFRVNAVSPGFILPPENAADDYFKKFKYKIPLNQPGHPDHIVKAILFLLDNEFITGEIITVDGGENL